MENTTQTPNTIVEPTPVTPVAPVTVESSNKKILVFTILLVLGTAFWLWSLSYRDSHHMMEDGSMMRNDQPAPVVTDESDLNDEIDASMQSESEIELREIDNEF